MSSREGHWLEGPRLQCPHKQAWAGEARIGGAFMPSTRPSSRFFLQACETLGASGCHLLFRGKMESLPNVPLELQEKNMPLAL